MSEPSVKYRDQGVYRVLKNLKNETLMNNFILVKYKIFYSWELKIAYNAHINGLPAGVHPRDNRGEFGILSLYSACERWGNYKLRNNRTTGGGEVGDFDVTI
jgi:hypothetical protein